MKKCLEGDLMNKIHDLKKHTRMLSGITAFILMFSSMAALGEEQVQANTDEVRQEEMTDHTDEAQETEQLTYEEFIKITTEAYEKYSGDYADHPIELIDFQLGYFMLNIDNCQNIFNELYNDGIIAYNDYKIFETNLTLGRNIVDIISAPRLPWWNDNFDFLHYEEKDKEAYRELFELGSKLYVDSFKDKVDIEVFRKFIKLCLKPDLSLEEKINIYCISASIDVVETPLYNKTNKNKVKKELEKFVNLNKYGGVDYTSLKRGVVLDADSDNIYELLVLYMNTRYKIFNELSKGYDYIFLDKLDIKESDIQ